MIQFAVTITGINCNFLLNNKHYLSTPLWLKHTILDIHYKPYNVHEAHTCTNSAKKIHVMIFLKILVDTYLNII